MDPTKRAVIVCRVSTDGQEDNYSLDVQEQQCRQSAVENGWQVVGVYRDVISGTIMDRPGLNAAIAMIQSKQAEVFLCSALDRFTRSQAHCYILMDRVEDLGGEVRFALEHFDDTPLGQFILSVKTFMAAVEREKMQARTGASLEAKKQKGEPLGTIPLGYKKLSKTEVVEDELTASMIRKMFEWYATGKHTLWGIVDMLEDEGYRTARGKPRFSHTIIGKMIANPRYKGDWPGNQWRQVQRKGKKPKSVLRPESEWIWNEGPAIVDPVTWRKANQIRTNARMNSPRRGEHPENFLLRGGFIRCGLCGNKMHGLTPGPTPGKKTREPYYQCGHRSVTGTNCQGTRIEAAKIDAGVWDFVTQVLSDPDVLSAWYDESTAEDTLDKQLVDAREILNAVENDLAQTSDRYAKAPAAILPNLEERIESLSLRLASAQTDINTIERAISDRENQVVVKERLNLLASHDLEQVDALPYEGKQRVMRDLGIKATVYRRTPDDNGIMQDTWGITLDTDLAFGGPGAADPSWYTLFDQPVELDVSLSKPCALLSATPRQ